LDPARLRRWARSRFAEGQVLEAGRWVPVSNRRGRRRLVRIVEVRGRVVVVDTNRRGTGQVLELEVELVRIQSPAAPASEPRAPLPNNPWRDHGGEG
jgi:FKBP-type peptidyl-prolyl cis-trans isomerase 2